MPVLTDGQGNASFSQTLPAEPGMVGQSYCNQWLVLDPGANPLNIAVSGCGQAVVGG